MKEILGSMRISSFSFSAKLASRKCRRTKDQDKTPDNPPKPRFLFLFPRTPPAKRVMPARYIFNLRPATDSLGRGTIHYNVAVVLIVQLDNGPHS
ncbi:hypothetical protein VNO77_15713 [Canavalia gladiata]|uniref:Uncharacterized protein n=1 Tax=Canavalia gladiata TaxID=3824 RepID=A0AAN9LZB0_CANGL